MKIGIQDETQCDDPIVNANQQAINTQAPYPPTLEDVRKELIKIRRAIFQQGLSNQVMLEIDRILNRIPPPQPPYWSFTDDRSETLLYKDDQVIGHVRNRQVAEEICAALNTEHV